MYGHTINSLRNIVKNFSKYFAKCKQYGTREKITEREFMEKEQKLIHICEVCGKAKIMTPEQAFNEGWDYPPRMGAFGVVSPRTCGNCGMVDTLWWALQSGAIKGIEDMTDNQKVIYARIQNEPASITPNEGR